MAEVLARFNDHVADDEGRAYRAQACGAPNADGLWDGWIEFIPLDGGPAVAAQIAAQRTTRADSRISPPLTALLSLTDGTNPEIDLSRQR